MTSRSVILSLSLCLLASAGCNRTESAAPGHAGTSSQNIPTGPASHPQGGDTTGKTAASSSATGSAITGSGSLPGNNAAEARFDGGNSAAGNDTTGGAR